MCEAAMSNNPKNPRGRVGAFRGRGVPLHEPYHTPANVEKGALPANAYLQDRIQFAAQQLLRNSDPGVLGPQPIRDPGVLGRQPAPLTMPAAPPTPPEIQFDASTFIMPQLPTTRGEYISDATYQKLYSPALLRLLSKLLRRPSLICAATSTHDIAVGEDGSTASETA